MPPRSIADLTSSRNEEYERMVLSEIMATRRMVPDLMPEYFCGENRTLYENLEQQWGKYGQLNPDLLPETCTRAALRCLDDAGNTSREVVDELHARYQTRSLGFLIGEALKVEDSGQAMRDMQGWIAEALFTHRQQNYDHGESVRRLVTALDRGVRENLSVVGFPIGIPEYDRLTNGFERGKVYVVGALKKTGKSRWMAFNALRLCENDVGVLIDSLEMSPVRLNHLALAYYSGMNSAKLGRMMQPHEYERVKAAMRMVEKLSWRIYQHHTVPDLRSRLIYEKSQAPIDVVFVDFIQRMHDSRYRGDRTREMERICQDLADLAREQDVAMVELTQLKGEAEFLGKDRRGKEMTQEQEEDAMPDMSYVKESHGISENADVITTLHNPKRHSNPYTDDGSYRYPTILCKVEQRDDVSGTVLRLKADLRTCQFSVWSD